MVDEGGYQCAFKFFNCYAVFGFIVLIFWLNAAIRCNQEEPVKNGIEGREVSEKACDIFEAYCIYTFFMFAGWLIGTNSSYPVNDYINLVCSK